MGTRKSFDDRSFSICRGVGAGLLAGLVSLVGACGVEPDAVAEDEISSQLKDTFADTERNRDGDACVVGSLATRACKREADWKESIARACRLFGGTLGRFAVSDRCDDGGFHKADFKCCPDAPPPPPPPPPPDRCSIEVLGGDTSCKPDATWKEYAVRLCDSKGLQLRDLSLSERCGDAQFRFAKIACCPAAPPPPPLCERAEQGDVTSCKPEATWKEYAAKDCQARGLTLRELAFADRCGDGQYRHAKYSCCK